MIEIFDAGGARNERKKWIHMFHQVSGLCYCASLVDFSRKCYEDGITNRLTESLTVFEEIANSYRLSSSPLFVFFGGVDLLRILIEKEPESVEEYFNTKNFNDICERIKGMFLNKISIQRKVYFFFVDMTDSKMIENVMSCMYGVTPYCVFQDSRYKYVPKNDIKTNGFDKKHFADVLIYNQI